MWLRVWLFALLAGASTLACGQELAQIVRGIITNQQGRALPGATAVASQDQTAVSFGVADTTGRFTLFLPPGRYVLTFSFVGHQTRETEWLVVGGKESIMAVELVEQPYQLGEVQIAATALTDVPPGSTNFTIEKALRVPANFFDPLRLAVSTPGVVAMNDLGNVVSVKGYTPNAMVWRLQGLDVLNPNHLANGGTFSDRPVAFGGSVSVLSAQVLDNTHFVTGWFPARYGNALSAAVDMQLREGNKNRHEFTAQASLVGLDLAAEGPVDKTQKISFLANYRYSTVGLLSGLGLNFGDEDIRFQDFTFHGHVQHAKSETSFFGFGGASSNRFERKPETEWKTEKDRYTIDFTGRVWTLGARHTWGQIWRWEFGTAVSSQVQNRNAKSADFFRPHINSELFEQHQVLLSSRLMVRRSWKGRQFEAGVHSNYQNGSLHVRTVVPLYLPDGFPNFSGTVSGMLVQPYLHYVHPLSARWEFQSGIRVPFFSFNRTHAWEPRMAIQRRLARGYLHFSYSQVSQTQALQTYLQSDNRGLDLTRSAQWQAAWQHQVGSYQLAVQAYYHRVRDVPVAVDGSLFSALNQFDEFAPPGLVNAGKGSQAGVAASLERSFSNSVYYALNGSLYRAMFTDARGVEYLSRFNGRYTGNFLAGKEWGGATHTLGVHFRFIYFGGLRQQVIDEATSQVFGTTIFDTRRGYVVRLPDYGRADVRVSWRKNKKNYTRTLALDIQNVTNKQHVAFTYFDTFLQRVASRNQLGIIPILVYRVDF